MSTKAQIRAVNKYNKLNTKIIPLRLNYKNDEDIISQLDKQTSKSAYIKGLIRKDIKRAKK